MIICPDCQGRKVTRCFMEYVGGGGGIEMMPCDTCQGTGEVDDGYPERKAIGEQKQRERINRHETMRDAAARLGITPVELSKLENGQMIGKEVQW